MGIDQNPIIEGTVLGSKYLNPEYLFDRGIEIARSISDYITSGGDGGGEAVSIFYNVLLVLSIFFLIIISYSSVRLLEIRRKERKHLEHEIAEYAHRQKEKAKKLEETEAISKNPRWIQTLAYLFSQHASDWKLSVIEADSMLEGLLGDLGFKGETLGERLK